MAAPYCIVMADDHTMFREGLRKILEQRGDIEVVGEVGDGIELLILLQESTPDMVLMDISMPKLGGIEATREIKANNSSVKIVVLSMHNNREYLAQTIAAGADGYLLKSAAGRELFAAIDTVINGKCYISPAISESGPDNFINICRSSGQPCPNTLTAREREVIKLIADGKRSRDIAALLYISPRTVEKHRSNIMKKLGINNIPALVRYAIQRGYSPSNA